MIISICIPCYRSSKTLPIVINEIKTEFNKHKNYDYQIVLVNDGSPDNTFEVITKLCKDDKKIVGVNLSKNQGQASAKMAAVHYVKGDILVYMDDDGQHPAEGIFALVDKIREGYDVVYAKFPKRKHTFFKKITSQMKKKLAELTGTKIKGIDTSSFQAWSKVCIEAIKRYDSPFPSAGAFLRCVTTRFANVDIQHRPRASGQSGYTFKKLFTLWLNGFTNFSIAPLRVASFCGVTIASIGFVVAIITIVRKIMNPSMTAGYASTIAILLFVSGMIMVMLGIIGEYIGRIYMILSKKPQYIVSETVNTKNWNGETLGESNR